MNSNLKKGNLYVTDLGSSNKPDPNLYNLHEPLEQAFQIGPTGPENAVFQNGSSETENPELQAWSTPLLEQAHHKGQSRDMGPVLNVTAERSAPVQVGPIIGLRDGFSEPKKIGKALLLIRGYFISRDFERKDTAPMLKWGVINSGESRPSSPVDQGQEVSLDGMCIGGPGLSPLIDDEFLMNVINMGLQEAFLQSLRNSWDGFPLADQADRR